MRGISDGVKRRWARLSLFPVSNDSHFSTGGEGRGRPQKPGDQLDVTMCRPRNPGGGWRKFAGVRRDLGKTSSTRDSPCSVEQWKSREGRWQAGRCGTICCIIRLFPGRVEFLQGLLGLPALNQRDSGRKLLELLRGCCSRPIPGPRGTQNLTGSSPCQKRW